MKLGIPEGENLEDNNNLLLPPSHIFVEASGGACVGTNDVMSLADIELCSKSLLWTRFATA